MAVPQAAKQRRIHGKRARARQRERDGHDLRPHYRREDLPATAHIGVVTIEDPYSEPGIVDRTGVLHVEATLEPVRLVRGCIGLDTANTAAADGDQKFEEGAIGRGCAKQPSEN